MAAGLSLDHDVVARMQNRLQRASPDLLREMVKVFAETLMAAEAEAICGTGYPERSSERTNRRNDYRAGDWDTRAGTIELAVPKLRAGDPRAPHPRLRSV